MALCALDHYDIQPRHVRLVTNHLNGLFRVEDTDGRRFALRISHPTWRDETDLHSEIAWLRALADAPEIEPHVPLPNRAGTYVTTVAAQGVPEARRCVLFTWLPGALLAHRLTAANVRAFGELAARLHTRAESFVPPEGFTHRRLDRVFPRREQVTLFDPAHAHVITPQRRVVIEGVLARTQAALDALYAGAEPPRVIHGDLHHENVKVHRGRLHPLDFEDVIWGYPVQDIALTFYDFRYFTDPNQHDEALLREWFQQGYSTRRPWPQQYPGQIDTFLVARRVWVLNWCLENLPPERNAAAMEREVAAFQRFLATTAP
jgi:Ser/Thr protein kinase RdoA (MazF antagonist)